MQKFYLLIILFLTTSAVFAQSNIFNGEPVQIVGAFNGYATNPYNADYRTLAYRKVSTTTNTQTDGRGQWFTTLNAQAAGGDITPVNLAGGGGNGFQLISGPSSNRFQNRWVFQFVGQAAIDQINNITEYSTTGTGVDMGINMNTAGHYTFVFNDAGYTITNAKYYVGYTTNAPVTVTRTSQILSTSPKQVQVNIATSATPSPQEKVYVRVIYTGNVNAAFNNTNTSQIIEATGAGTNYQAIIPATVNDAGVYYVFTSTKTQAELTAFVENDRTIAALRFDDNAGINYPFSFPTPIKLLSFEGNRKQELITLKWTTGQEYDVEKFELEASENGQVFKTVATANPTNTNSIQNYVSTFNDFSNNYFRLKEVAINGDLSFSKVVYLPFDKKANLLVVPTAAQQQANLLLQNFDAGNYQATIVDATGRVVKNWRLQVTTSNQALPLLNNNMLAAGTYSIVLSNGNNSWKTRFIKL
jgi:hypothetical protein